MLMSRTQFLEMLCDMQMLQIETDSEAPEFELGWATFYWILLFVQFAIIYRRSLDPKFFDISYVWTSADKSS